MQVTQQVLNRFSEAIQQSGVDVVPRVVVSGGRGDGEQGSTSSSIMEALLAMLLSDRFGALAQTQPGQRSPEAEALRDQIRKDMQNKTVLPDEKKKE